MSYDAEENGRLGRATATLVKLLLNDPDGPALFTALWRLRREDDYEKGKHPTVQTDWAMALETARDEVIWRALDHFGNQGRAAEALGIARCTVVRAAQRMRVELVGENAKFHRAS